MAKVNGTNGNGTKGSGRAAAELMTAEQAAELRGIVAAETWRDAERWGEWGSVGGDGAELRINAGTLGAIIAHRSASVSPVGAAAELAELADVVGETQAAAERFVELAGDGDAPQDDVMGAAETLADTLGRVCGCAVAASKAAAGSGEHYGDGKAAELAAALTGAAELAGSAAGALGDGETPPAVVASEAADAAAELAELARTLAETFPPLYASRTGKRGAPYSRRALFDAETAGDVVRIIMRGEDKTLAGSGAADGERGAALNWNGADGAHVALPVAELRGDGAAELGGTAAELLGEYYNVANDDECGDVADAIESIAGNAAASAVWQYVALIFGSHTPAGGGTFAELKARRSGAETKRREAAKRQLRAAVSADPMAALAELAGSGKLPQDKLRDLMAALAAQLATADGGDAGETGGDADNADAETAAAALAQAAADAAD